MINADLHSRSGVGSQRPADSFRQCPVGVGLAMSCGVLFAVAALLSPWHGAPHGAVDLAVLGALVGVAGVLLSTPTALGAAVFSALLLNGFLIDRDGTLQWHGWVELTRLGLLLAAALAGSALGWLLARRERRDAGDEPDAELASARGDEPSASRTFIPYPSSVPTGTAVHHLIHRSVRHG